MSKVTEHHKRASALVPRGVSSGARSRTTPLVFNKAHGAHVWDLDGNRYVDCVMALGPILLGHSHRPTVEAICAQVERGALFGTSPLEADVAERLMRFISFGNKTALVSTGSEAVHLAVRIARATTGRRLVVKFDGHYHGWIDPVFVSPPGQRIDGDPRAEHGVEGEPASDDVHVIRWNDPDEFTSLMARIGPDVACVLMEPIPFNFGGMLPLPGYLETVRRICDRTGALLVFDEILTGIRLGREGATGIVGVQPDIATYGKALAAGMPLAAVVGTDEAMDSIVNGPVQPAGTYSGSPVSLAAAIAVLDELDERGDEIYSNLNRLGRQLSEGFRGLASDMSIPLVVNQVGSIAQMLWDPREPVQEYRDADVSDRDRIAALCEGVAAHGVFAVPRGLLLLSDAHTTSDVDMVLRAFSKRARQIDHIAAMSVGDSAGSRPL